MEAAALFGFATGGDGPAEQSLARVTNEQFGDATRPNDLARSDVDPAIEDRLVWVLVYRNASFARLGPPPSSLETLPRSADGVTHLPEDDRPVLERMSLFVLVDATTGKYLRAETF